MDNKVRKGFFTVLPMHKGLFTILILFTLVHGWLWTHYCLSMWGWVRYLSIFSGEVPTFLLWGLFYWFLYCAVLLLSYAYGKKTFIVVCVFYFICVGITIPFSLAQVDLSPKFALLLKSSFDWVYFQNYLFWVLGSLLVLVPLLGLLIYFLAKTYKPHFVFRKRWRIVVLSILGLIIFWHLLIVGNIDEESIPSPLYDNEMGRVLRTFEALTFYKFDLFSNVKLEGSFKTYEGQYPEHKMGVHGVYAFLDTLQYEFLSIHGNPFVPKNLALEKLIKQGLLLDFGPVLSCGSHTTASIPNMYSFNDCRVGPFFHSEILPKLLNRIGINNYYVGLEGLSQYFYTVFEKYVKKEHKHYISYEDTAKALDITGKYLDNYQDLPSSLTAVYYDAVHPGLKCSFITGGGLPESSCQGFEHFSTGTAEYPLGMSKAVQVIEEDITHFIKRVENNPRPIFLLLTSDHGLSQRFLHGDMADAEISPDHYQDAVQRHTNLLFYGNKAYRELQGERWKILQKNASNLKGWLNHRVLMPSILDALEIKWDKGEEIFDSYSIFSKELKKENPMRIQTNQYLKKINLPKM